MIIYAAIVLFFSGSVLLACTMFYTFSRALNDPSVDKYSMAYNNYFFKYKESKYMFGIGAFLYVIGFFLVGMSFLQDVPSDFDSNPANEKVSEDVYSTSRYTGVLYFKELYEKDFLTVKDCRNIDFVKWLFLKETGMYLLQKINYFVEDDYTRGTSHHITDLPVYYEVRLTEAQFKNYQDFIYTISAIDDWEEINSNETVYEFRRTNKFGLSCKIKKDLIRFGFRNLEEIN